MPSFASRYWPLALATALFLIPALLISRQIGLEVDEALVTAGIFDGLSPAYSLHIAGRELPLMLLSYVGTLRTWFYNGLFLLVPPSAMALRLPMILCGVATLFVFWRLALRAGGRWVAGAAVLLLATDPSWMLNEAIDFGYVAVQHLLKLAGVLCAVRYFELRRTAWLAAAGFLFGLAVWDKAVFVWVLAGLSVAMLASFPRALLSIPVRAGGLALATFAIGAAPWILFNVVRPLETFRANARLGGEPFAPKVRVLKETVEGRLLFGFYTAADAGTGFRPPHRTAHHAAYGVARWLGEPREQLTLYACFLSILTAPWWWQGRHRRAILFCWIFFMVTFLAAALSRGGGGAAHHVILAWPAHLLAIALTFDELADRLRRGRLAAIGAVALLVFANLAVANQYYVEAIRQGPGPRFTDAIHPLYARVTAARATPLAVADWGIAETLVLLSEGRIPLALALPIADPRAAAHLIENPGSTFVSHGPGFEILPGNGAKLDELARAKGRVRQPLETIYDRNGRPIFELFRYGRAR